MGEKEADHLISQFAVKKADKNLNKFVFEGSEEIVLKNKTLPIPHHKLEDQGIMTKFRNAEPFHSWKIGSEFIDFV